MSATTTPALQNILLCCPKCGDQEAGISVQLHSLGDAATDAFFCGSCEETFGTDDIEAFIAKWSKVVAWVKTAPQFEE